MATITLEQAIGGFPRAPHCVTADEQDTLPSRYGWPVKLLSLAAFTLAFVGWLNETWLFMFESPIWLNRYTEYAIILAFGIWRIVAEKNVLVFISIYSVFVICGQNYKFQSNINL